MRVAILQFPGSNCDHDVARAFGPLLGHDVQWAWHADADLPPGTELAVLPGGFSYGDYLRCGAIAAHAPIMAAVRRLAEQGGAVLGVCNGFQILTEARLLPGVLLRNTGLQFLCKDVTLRVESQKSRLTSKLSLHSRLVMPIAHMDGNYFADTATLDALEANDQVVLRYVDGVTGETTASANPNGSARHIAGICNAAGNVVGLMPHPERAVEALLGRQDGRRMLQGLIDALAV